MGMDLDKLAGVAPAVDEDAVEEELHMYLIGVRDDREPWAITTVGQADWAMQLVADADRRTRQYQDEIDLWTDAKRRLSSGADWLRDRLEEWAVGLRTDKAKSFPLAHGTVATRKTKPAIDVIDEEALIAWAREHAPGSLHTVERCNKSELGDAAVITEVIVAYEAIDKTTGDVERVPVPKVSVFDEAKLDRLRERLGDNYQVNPEFALAVLDPDGELVPGVEIRPERVTATVTPLGL